jgi:hypothetical protein
MLQYPVRFIVAFGAGLLVAFAVPEAAYRFQLYQSLVVNAEYSIITTDTRAGFTGDKSLGGLFPPGRDVTMRQYRLDSSFGRQVRFHSNNLGWISRHDYAPDKEQGEFRIAIIGDSLTASITNDRPWVDVVQRELSGDGELLRAIGARKITVLNLGSPATGPVRMAQRSLPFAQRLNADMLIANFGIESPHSLCLRR